MVTTTASWTTNVDVTGSDAVGGATGTSTTATGPRTKCVVRLQLFLKVATSLVDLLFIELVLNLSHVKQMLKSANTSHT